MVDLQEIFSYLRISLFGLIIVVASIYSIPIIFLRRFHFRYNMLTLNICLATIFASIYWFTFYLCYHLDIWGTFGFLMNNCRFSLIFPVILTLQVPFSFVTASISRFFAVVYHHQPLFKTKFWIIISIGSQWILCSFLPLPLLLDIGMFCSSPRWHDIYKLMIIVVIPGFVFLLTNILIFNRVRQSSRRIQTQSSQTGNQHEQFSRRDIHLFRHMIVMISIFIGGWAPLYILLSIQSQFTIEPILSSSLTIVCELALLCDIIDLYLYNHELRNFLKKIVFCQ